MTLPNWVRSKVEARLLPRAFSSPTVLRPVVCCPRSSATATRQLIRLWQHGCSFTCVPWGIWTPTWTLKMRARVMHWADHPLKFHCPMVQRARIGASCISALTNQPHPQSKTLTWQLLMQSPTTSHLLNPRGIHHMKWSQSMHKQHGEVYGLHTCELMKMKWVYPEDRVHQIPLSFDCVTTIIRPQLMYNKFSNSPCL